MFRKIFFGFVLFFMAVVLAVGMVAVTGLAVVGAAVGSTVENLDLRAVEVTDVNGNIETYTVGELLSEASRIEVIGDNGEYVTIDLNLPQITVQDDGGEVSRVVIGDDSGFQFREDSQIRIDGRNFNTFDGGFIGRLIGGFFKGMFTLAFWGLVVFGVVMVLRSRKPAAAEKTQEDAVV
jgi:hypothetical protein